MLGLPIFDTCFAILRRVSHGQMAKQVSKIGRPMSRKGTAKEMIVAYLNSPWMETLCVAGGVAAMLFLNRIKEEDSKK